MNYPSDDPKGLLSNRPIIGNSATTASSQQGVAPSPQSPELLRELKMHDPALQKIFHDVDRKR